MRISLLGTGFRKAPMGRGSFAFRLLNRDSKNWLLYSTWLEDQPYHDEKKPTFASFSTALRVLPRKIKMEV